jgi:hypothetical protein
MLPSSQGGWDTTERVVIGERDRAKTGRNRSSHDCLGSDAPIRGGRMNMQVDRFTTAGRRFGGAQRRYPISGAVQDGCEWLSKSRSSWSLSWPSDSSRLLAPRGE